MHHFLFGGNTFSRIAASDIVARIINQIFVEIGSAAELDDVFTIQNSHFITFQHNLLMYCACGKLNINTLSPKGCKGPTQAYIIDHEYVKNVKYWAIYAVGNHITKMKVIMWDHQRKEYPVGDFYPHRLAHIRFTV